MRSNYGGAHPRPDLVERFVYGLPELYREKIQSTRFVRLARVFATTVELALLPLAKAGLLEGRVEVRRRHRLERQRGHTDLDDASPRPARRISAPTDPSSTSTSRRSKGPSSQPAAATCPSRSVPVSAPLTRGIFATAFVRVPAPVSEATLKAGVGRLLRRGALRSGSSQAPPGGRRRRRVLLCGGGARRWSRGGATLGSSHAFEQLDNLVKGGAGQAIQSMNLMLGLDERLSLEDVGAYP